MPVSSVSYRIRYFHHLKLYNNFLDDDIILYATYFKPKNEMDLNAMA